MKWWVATEKDTEGSQIHVKTKLVSHRDSPAALEDSMLSHYWTYKINSKTAESCDQEKSIHAPSKNWNFCKIKVLNWEVWRTVWTVLAVLSCMHVQTSMSTWSHKHIHTQTSRGTGIQAMNERKYILWAAFVLWQRHRRDEINFIKQNQWLSVYIFWDPCGFIAALSAFLGRLPSNQPSIPSNYAHIGWFCTLWFTSSPNVQCQCQK